MAAARKISGSKATSLTGAMDLLACKANVEGVSGISSAGQLYTKLRGRDAGQLSGSLAEVGVLRRTNLSYSATRGQGMTEKKEETHTWVCIWRNSHSPPQPVIQHFQQKEQTGAINTSNYFKRIQGDLWGCVISCPLHRGIEHPIHDCHFCVVKDES